MNQIVKNTVNQTEIFNKQSETQTEDLANKFRAQTLRCTEETKIIKEQTEFLKKIMNERINEFENKINNYEVKFNTLQQRRELDLEGIITDTNIVKKRTKDIEDKIRKRGTGSEVEKEKENIINDVQRLKNEIRQFQDRLKDQHEDHENERELEEA